MVEMREAGFTAGDTDAFRQGLADITEAAVSAGTEGIAAYAAEPETLLSPVAQLVGWGLSIRRRAAAETHGAERNTPVFDSGAPRIYSGIFPEGFCRERSDEPIGVASLLDVDPECCIAI